MPEAPRNSADFKITSSDGTLVADIPLTLSAFRKIIRDYFTVCESYYDAIESASPSKIEALIWGEEDCTTKAPGCCAKSWKNMSRSTIAPRDACSR